MFLTRPPNKQSGDLIVLTCVKFQLSTSDSIKIYSKQQQQEWLDLLEIELFVDVLQIVDVLLATTPAAWNEVGSVEENILHIHEVILSTADRISDYLYTDNAKFQFQFKGDVTSLKVIKFDNFTNENFSPTPRFDQLIPPYYHTTSRNIELKTNMLYNNNTNNPVTCLPY